ncbi:hypothetical protein [Alterinioella nitratireducens]|uniref:hypothetical protein n=1 Tax=Rhodobacterales TaxID=204455 RepID=UPI004058B68A
MTDLPPAILARQALDTLRRETPDGRIVAEEEIVPGLRFVPDPEAGMTGHFSSPRGRLLELQVRHARPARWLGLHLRLDIEDITEIGLIGLATRIAAPTAMAVRACVRSGTETGFVDTFFDKTVATLPRPQLHLDVLETNGAHAALCAPAPWRELVLFLPMQDFRLDLHDLRVFAA